MSGSRSRLRWNFSIVRSTCGSFIASLSKPSDHDDQRLDAAEALLNLRVRDVVRRVLEEQRRRRRRVADREAAHEVDADHRDQRPADERDGLASRREERAREALDPPAERAALAQHDQLGLRRLQVVVHDRIQKHLGDRDRENPPRGRDRELLQHHDRHQDDHQHAEGVGRDARRRSARRARRRRRRSRAACANRTSRTLRSSDRASGSRDSRRAP